jgi:hypothetical protein
MSLSEDNRVCTFLTWVPGNLPGNFFYLVPSSPLEKKKDEVVKIAILILTLGERNLKGAGTETRPYSL